MIRLHAPPPRRASYRDRIRQNWPLVERTVKAPGDIVLGQPERDIGISGYYEDGSPW